MSSRPRWQCPEFDLSRFTETGCYVYGGLKAAPQAAKGLYRWGRNGCRKTILLDLFLRSLPRASLVCACTGMSFSVPGFTQGSGPNRNQHRAWCHTQELQTVGMYIRIGGAYLRVTS